MQYWICVRRGKMGGHLENALIPTTEHSRCSNVLHSEACCPQSSPRSTRLAQRSHLEKKKWAMIERIPNFLPQKNPLIYNRTWGSRSYIETVGNRSSSRSKTSHKLAAVQDRSSDYNSQEEPLGKIPSTDLRHHFYKTAMILFHLSIEWFMH